MSPCLSAASKTSCPFTPHTVGAVQVVDVERDDLTVPFRANLAGDLGVLARDGAVVDPHVHDLFAADADLVLAERELRARRPAD
jgi:hypothetical protein